MATFVVLKTSLSATTASFFAALSTASSLRLAVIAHLGAGPSGCTRRPARHLIPEREGPERHEGRDDILKPALPKPCGAIGVSRFEPNSFHAAQMGSREAKSGLHPSMQAIRLSRGKPLSSSRAPAVSDRIEVAGQTDGPCPIPPRRRILLLSSEPDGRPEGTFSCRFSILECEHGRASNSQHVRRRLFIRFRT